MSEHHNHELTGEPYLGVSIYMRSSLRRKMHKAMGGRFNWIFEQHFVDERGRESWRSRKWPNMPSRLLYRLDYKLRPFKCRIGWHCKADIHEIDASVWRASCIHCHAFPLKAHKPQSADPEEARRWEESNELDEALSEAIDAYKDGDGPCPFCTPPEGEKHAYTCWENE